MAVAPGGLSRPVPDTVNPDVMKKSNAWPQAPSRQLGNNRTGPAVAPPASTRHCNGRRNQRLDPVRKPERSNGLASRTLMNDTSWLAGERSQRSGVARRRPQALLNPPTGRSVGDTVWCPISVTLRTAADARGTKDVQRLFVNPIVQLRNLAIRLRERRQGSDSQAYGWLQH